MVKSAFGDDGLRRLQLLYETRNPTQPNDVENDASARPQNAILASSDLDL